jgi:hypothetical protein
MVDSHIKLLTANSRTFAIGQVFSPAPLYFPAAWVTDEAADTAPPKLTVFPDGRVAGVVAPAGVCTLNEVTPGECWTVPRPADGRGSTLFCPLDSGELDEEYRKAHVGTMFVDNGDGTVTEVVCANLAGAGGHAIPGRGVQAAQVHYNDATNDTRYMAARGRYVWSDEAGGIVFVGALWPEVDERKAAEVRAAACSIDFHMIRGQGIDDYRLVGCCLVNIGALPSRFASLIDTGSTVAVTPELARTAIREMEQEHGYSRAAALATALDFSEDPMSRRMRIVDAPGQPTAPPVLQRTANVAVPPCTCGAHDQQQAAYVVVDDPSPAWCAEVSWAGGTGAFMQMIELADGAAGYVVAPVTDGSLSFADPVVVASTDATVTGRKFEYVWADEQLEDLVITASRTAAVTEDAGAEPDVLQRLDRIEDAVGNLTAAVQDYIQSQVDAALAEV